ncbi:hypothetical protein ASZ90_017736 [hydrocarbon metagenome]|uniref:Uncharacterized protein n=1 Tax=hydrocarbon metagenome TaxID=938273 RepID=A0A0W8E881_9ZZZZ
MASTSHLYNSFYNIFIVNIKSDIREMILRAEIPFIEEHQEFGAAKLNVSFSGYHTYLNRKESKGKA